MSDKFSLEIRDLHHKYEKKTILRNVDWTLSSGKIYVLLGDNGAGKTTFLNIIAGAFKSTTGKIVYVDEYGEKKKESYLKDFGYLTEYPYLYSYLTSLEMVRLVGSLKGLNEKKIAKAIEKWFHIFGLNPYRDEKIENLSQGTKKRLAFVISIIHEPKVILLDEPTNGLDPHQIVLFRGVLLELANQGSLILLSTHIMDLAEKLADEVGIIFNQTLYKDENKGDLEEFYLSFNSQ